MYDQLFEYFYKEVFGEYKNKVPRVNLHEYLMASGWMYFSVKDLNTLFSIMYEKLGPEGAMIAESELSECQDGGDYKDQIPESIYVPLKIEGVEIRKVNPNLTSD